jgi:transcriptional regulator with XRE-family HTH domain
VDAAVSLTEAERRQCGAAIRRIREARGWGRRQLSDESGVPESTIRDIERGAVPHDDTLARLLETLDVEFTTFGIMSPWMADQIGALIALAQQVPRDRLPETIGALMTILGRVARGLDLTSWVMNPSISQVVVAGEADIDQNIS